MRAMRIMIAFGIAVLMAGCVVPSLNPLFDEKDLVFEPALVGTWRKVAKNDTEKGESTLTFQKSGDDGYDLIYTENGGSAQFKAHLVRLAEFLFLDTYPEYPEIKNTIHKAHLVQAHAFSRIWIDGDILRLAILDHEWLKGMIVGKKVKIDYEWHDRIVLTAPTHDLQKLVVSYAEDAKAFSALTEWHRQK